MANMKRSEFFLLVGALTLFAGLTACSPAAGNTNGDVAASGSAPVGAAKTDDGEGFRNSLSVERLKLLVRGLDLADPETFGSREAYMRLSSDLSACYQALEFAGVGFQRVSARYSGDGCGFDDAIALEEGLVTYRSPEQLVMTCDTAARLHLWERQVVAPAAERYFGSSLAAIEALGGYSCRRVGGSGPLSEHAFGRAADVAGFTLVDGRRITVLEHYFSQGPEGDFLREIRKGACQVFDVTLSPDYNEAHADHLHLDTGGERVCH
jgi:hypothetical protein